MFVFILSMFKLMVFFVVCNDCLFCGYGMLFFIKDFSKVYVYVVIEGVNFEDIVMFYIYCGCSGQLGFIIVDFGLENDLLSLFEDGVLFLEIINEDIVVIKDYGYGFVVVFIVGCLIMFVVFLDKVVIVVGMVQIVFE